MFFPYPTFARESATANLLAVRSGIDTRSFLRKPEHRSLPYPAFACKSVTANVSWLCAQKPIGIQLGFRSREILSGVRLRYFFT